MYKFRMTDDKNIVLTRTLKISNAIALEIEEEIVTLHKDEYICELFTEPAHIL